MNKKYDMKKIVLWLLIIMISGFAIGAAILVSTGGIEILEGDVIAVKGKYNYNINDEKPVDIQDVENISIRSVSSDIKLIPTEASEIKAHFYGSISTNKENYIPELIVEKSGGKVSVEVRWPNVVNVGFMNSNLKLDVYIPSDYSENLELDTTSANVSIDKIKINKFRCETVSGDLSATSIEADVFHHNTTSGDLVAQSIQAKEITIETTSGTASAGFRCESFKFNSVSGDLSADSFQAVDTVIVTTSGRATLQGLTGDLKFESISGDLQAEYQTFNNNIQVESSSGTTNIRLPAESQFYLDFKSTSGEIDVGDFPVTVKGSIKDHRLEGVVGSDSNRIVIHSMSGDARIYK